MKCSVLILSNGGMPNGVDHSSKKGLGAADDESSLHDTVARSRAESAITVNFFTI